MANPEVYPITAALEDSLKDCMDHPSVQQIAETVGEYEHGTADVEDVFADINLPALSHDQMLRLYAAVAQDLALTLESWG